LSVRDTDKPGLVQVAAGLIEFGFTLVATRGTAKFLKESGIKVDVVNKYQEGRPHVVDMLKNDEISFIVNTTEGKNAIDDSSAIRRIALQRKVYNATTLAGANACIDALGHGEKFSVHRLQDLHARTLKKYKKV
jgi:carbamoyl-phosphate synthase large subunit